MFKLGVLLAFLGVPAAAKAFPYLEPTAFTLGFTGISGAYEYIHLVNTVTPNFGNLQIDSLTVNQATGPNQIFHTTAFTSGSCPTILAAGASCDLRVQATSNDFGANFSGVDHLTANFTLFSTTNVANLPLSVPVDVIIAQREEIPEPISAALLLTGGLLTIVTRRLG